MLLCTPYFHNPKSPRERTETKVTNQSVSEEIPVELSCVISLNKMLNIKKHLLNIILVTIPCRADPASSLPCQHHPDQDNRTVRIQASRSTKMARTQRSPSNLFRAAVAERKSTPKISPSEKILTGKTTPALTSGPNQTSETRNTRFLLIK